MIRNLKDVMKNKSYCEIKFMDGESLYGFITKVGSETFDIVTMEAIDTFEEVKNHEDMDLMDFFFDKPDENADHLFVKHTYESSMVCGIVHDVSHRIKPSVVQSMNFYKDRTIFAPKPSKVIKNKSKPITNPKTK
jgi:hypothetical protein